MVKFIINLIKDYRRLNWLEQKQVKGEWIHQAIHWTGQKIRDEIDEEMRMEKEEKACK